MNQPGPGGRKRVSAGTAAAKALGARSSRPNPPGGNRPAAAPPSGRKANKKPDSTKKKIANSAVRKGASTAITAVTGGTGAPVSFVVGLIGTDEVAKRRRKLVYMAIATIIVLQFLFITALVGLAVSAALMGSGSGAAGSESAQAGECLDISAPRVTNGGAGGGQTAAAGSLGAPLDAEYMQSASGFGGRDAPTAGATSWHDGIDFSGPGIHGKPIYAVADGVVEQAGPASGYGNWILLDHTIAGQKVTTLYGHIEDGHLKVKAGDIVKAGQHIADVGSAGVSTGPHLHFGVYPGGWKSQGGVDPMPWLKKFKAESKPANDTGGGDTGHPATAVAATQLAPAPATDHVTEADWDKLAQLESGGNWKTNTGNGFSGGLQFTTSTWNSSGGTRYAPMPYQASKNEQMEVANNVLKSQGWQAWPPSARAGIRNKKPAPEGTFASSPTADRRRPAPSGQTAEPNLPKTAQGDENNLQAAAQRGMRLAAARFPRVQHIGGYRSGPNAMDHGTGTAIDIMVEQYASPEGIAYGDQIAKLFIDNAGELDVKYVIWRNRIWQNGSWSDYGSTGDDTDKHNNHVHVSFNQSGPPTAVVKGLPGQGAPAADGNKLGGDGQSDTPDGVQPYEPSGEQQSQQLTAEQQANIKAMIAAARRSDLKPAGRAAVLATAYSGAQTNFISKVPTPDDARIGIFGEVPLEGADSGDLSNLINPPYAANRFFTRLKEVAAQQPQWATMPLPDVLVAMYPDQRTMAPQYGSWERLAIGAVTTLWSDPYAKASADMAPVAATNDQCRQGGGGRQLKPGSVPQRFQKWITLAGQICEGMTAPLLAAQIEQESGFNEQATSGVGALGSSQFMPYTWTTWGKPVDENGKPTGPAGAGDPRKAADATMAQGNMMCSDYNAIVKLIKDGKVKGDPVALTLAAYNAGIGAIISAGGMPSGGDYSTQTQPYVDKIMSNAKKFDGGGGQLKTDSGASGDQGGMAAAIDFARKQIGKRYILGANGPNAFDCSSLTQHALRAAGITVTRTTYTQVKEGTEIGKDQAVPGDLVFSNWSNASTPEHVSLYIGNGKVIQAHSESVGVVETPLPSGRLMFRHITPNT